MQVAVRPWQRAPFLRPLLPFMLGIGTAWSLPLVITGLILLAMLLLLAAYRFLPLKWKFRMRIATGLCMHLLLFSAGSFLYRWHDIRHTDRWIGNKTFEQLLVRLEAPLVRKQNSWKGEASVLYMIRQGRKEQAAGKLLLYFALDANTNELDYGSVLLIHQSLQPVRGSGNPGAFDYGRWCFFQGITHQAYLKKGSFAYFKVQDARWWKASLFHARAWVLQTLRLYFKEPTTLGLAEALLIGYKDDLDKALLQSYSNTGVVHVIAISGLHLGLIYSILLLLTKPMGRRRSTRTIRLLLILAGLWLFSITAGAGPSIVRSAVMFSCIAFGTVLQRRTAILNTLALSAFLLLCYDPYWLWDAGFQLSYTAVLSIVLFYKPVYNWFYFRNGILNAAWKITAVSIAAQLLTLPVTTFHFNQFPTWFLFTNMVAVPLSSAILIGEILLCAISFLQPTWLAFLVEKGMQWMNAFILYFDTLSHAAWTGLNISFLQAVLLTGFILCVSYALMEKVKAFLFAGCCCLLLFTVCRSLSFAGCAVQQKLVVYHIPKHAALDLFSGRRVLFIGDQNVLRNKSLFRFHMQPGRIAARAVPATMQDPGTHFRFAGCTVWLVNGKYAALPKVKTIDLLVASGLSAAFLVKHIHQFTVRQVVADGSLPYRAARQLEACCKVLGIPFHDVKEKGAFVLQR